MTATTTAPGPIPGAKFAPGSRWTFTCPDGEVRRYILHSYAGGANVYKLYNVELFPDGPPDDWTNHNAAWASPKWLMGSPGGWASGWPQGEGE